ncbi:MAG: hypothetical protein HZC47_08550, partial [Methanobacterium sp.]|nr:hypothetical protein [Methanobacterium sp.]
MNFRFCIASVLFFVLVFSFCSGVVFADVHYANPGNYKSVLGAAGYSDTI